MSRETDGERQVPDTVWNLPHFQNWLQAQKSAGNRLDGFKPVMEFFVADGRFLFAWAAQVNIYVAAEDRNKSNELVVSRPDIKHVVCLHKSEAGTLQAVMVREFRSTAATPNGFILESPGGSSFKKESALETACSEVFEETGLTISPERLVPIGLRQLAGTFSAHKAYVYAVHLDTDDMEKAVKEWGKPHGDGDTETSERTFVEVHDVEELLSKPTTDWSTLGMIYAAVDKLGLNR